MKKNKIYIIADDLTGAADCASRCFGYGYSAEVFIDPQVMNTISDVCAFTTDSRSLSHFEAGKRTREIIKTIDTTEVLWYKKIDSTLRGNIGGEIDAFLDTLNFDFVLVCPAFPLQRRGLYKGTLLLNNEIRESSHLPTILAAQSMYPCLHIPLNMLEGKLSFLIEFIIKEYIHGTRIFSLDAITESHLTKVVEAYRKLPYKILLSGSAGLVSTLVSSGVKAETAGNKEKPLAAYKRVLIVAGSGSDTIYRQIHFLKAHRDVKVISTDDTLDDLLVPTILAHLPAPAKGISLDSADSRKALDQLIQVATKIINVQKPDLLIVTGGDTSMELLTRLGVKQLIVERELFPGIPLTTGKGQNGKVFQFILKPGAFGDDAIFVDLLNMLQACRGSDQ